MSTELSVRNDMDPMIVARALAASGYFQDAKDANQALVKILAGREMGLGEVASMTGIYIVKGRPSLSANLLAGVLKRNGKYNYRVLTPPAERARVCEIAFFERNGSKWEEIGRSVFTAEDARRAGTQNMDRYPANMLFARAMTNGIRWYCPDVFAGGVYTPEELGAQVDADGDVIDVKADVSVVAAEDNAPVRVPDAPKTNGNGHAPKPAANGDAKRDAVQKRFSQVARDAKAIGVPVEDLPADISTDDLIEKGKALRKAVVARAEFVINRHPQGKINLDDSDDQMIAQAVRLYATFQEPANVPA